MKITEVNPQIAALVEKNGGYCPCAVVRTTETYCPCKEFKDQPTPSTCRCGRYKKED